MKRVNSSNIHAIGYNPDSKEMHVQFGLSKDRRMPGKTYAYTPVTPDEHEALMCSTSKGSHFAAHIKPHKACRPVASP